MKKPLNAEVFFGPGLNIPEAATLDSCYDHVREDYFTPEQEESAALHPNDFETPGVAETE